MLKAMGVWQMPRYDIWSPIKFDEKWNSVKTEKFDIIYPSWEKRRAELQKNEEQYKRFMDQLKRKQAIDTGILERMYDLKKGITETFIKEGFVDSYLQHGDTDIAPNLLMKYLGDNFEAIDFIFDFVKNDRQLSVGYIKELHSLITRHQDSTEAIDQFGNRVRITLVKGQFKNSPNNPMRDGIVYNYCPPEQVESEMDNLISIFNRELGNAHILVKAAFLHHAFVQIHPFQDGNGRIARLLASFVLIKEGLFPLTIDRDERIKYIAALESADQKEYQALIDVISFNQINSIERALNWQIIENTSGYDDVLNVLGAKLSNYRMIEVEQQNKRILQNMNHVFLVIRSEMENYKEDLQKRLDKITEIDSSYCPPEEANAYYYARQIINYANQYDYYVNLSLNKCWGRMFISIDQTKKYRLILSVHHYGYDKSTFAVGAFLSKEITGVISEETGSRREYIDIPVGVPPLTLSSEKDIDELKSSIKQQVEISIMSALAYIANEL